VVGLQDRRLSLGIPEIAGAILLQGSDPLGDSTEKERNISPVHRAGIIPDLDGERRRAGEAEGLGDCGRYQDQSARTMGSMLLYRQHRKETNSWEPADALVSQPVREIRG
jgi:hypothetical protein